VFSQKKEKSEKDAPEAVVGFPVRLACSAKALVKIHDRNKKAVTG
jgi:hypothetical protein